LRTGCSFISFSKSSTHHQRCVSYMMNPTSYSIRSRKHQYQRVPHGVQQCMDKTYTRQYSLGCKWCGPFASSPTMLLIGQAVSPASPSWRDITSPPG
jgi:hypothetical protein